MISAGLLLLAYVAYVFTRPSEEPIPSPSVTTETSTPSSTATKTVTETSTQTVLSTMPRPSVVPLPPTSSTSAVWSGVIVGTCDEGGSCGVKQRTAPYVDAPRLVARDLQDGMTVPLVCTTTGDLRSNGGYGTSSIWYRLINGAYVNSVYIETAASASEVPSC